MPTELIRYVSRNNPEQVDLGIVIVNWNVKDLLAKNLDALRVSEGPFSARIIVVDNASSDGSKELFQDGLDFVYVYNDKNLGFAKGVNQGIAKANARHVLLLNPDMKVQPDALAKTISYLDAHPDVGVLGGRLTSMDGATYPSVRRLPDVWSQTATMLQLPKLFPKILDRYMATDFDYTKEQEAPSVRGSYFAISNAALRKLGGLDERYFIWFEEVDYCHQALRSGFKVMYAPDIVASDFVGRSFAQRKLFWKQKQFTKSMSQYFWKWQPGWRAALISVIRPFPVVAAWIHDHIKS